MFSLFNNKRKCEILGVKNTPISMILFSLVFPVLLLAQNDVEVIWVNPEKIKPLSFEESTEITAIVKLENLPDRIISDISKIRMSNNRIFIFDFRAMTVFAFNREGKSLFYLDAQGQGSGQFQRMTDFEIDTEKKELYIFDELSYKVITYTFDGSFIREDKVGFFAFNLAKIGDNWFFNGTSETKSTTQKKLIVTDNLFQEVDQVLTIKKTAFTNAYKPSFFIPYKNEYRILIGENEFIFKLGSNGVEPIYKVDFGKYNINKTITSEMDARNALFSFSNSVYAGKKGNYVETSDWVGFSYVKNNTEKTKSGRWRFVFYSKKDKTVIHHFTRFELSSYKAQIPFPIHTDGNQFMTKVDYYDLFGSNKKMLNNSSRDGISKGYGTLGIDLAKVLNTIKKDDNPYLVFYKVQTK